MFKKRKDMTNEEKLQLGQSQYKKSANDAGLYEMTDEDCDDLRRNNGYEGQIFGSQEQKKILHCFDDEHIEFSNIPIVYRKGNTTSDFLCDDKKILIEVKMFDASKIKNCDLNKVFKERIKKAIDHCIEKADSSHEGYTRIVGLVVPYLGGFSNDNLLLNIVGKGENINIEDIVTNYKNWKNDRIDAMVIFIEAPRHSEYTEVKENFKIAICKNGDKIGSEIFKDSCKVKYVGL